MLGYGHTKNVISAKKNPISKFKLKWNGNTNRRETTKKKPTQQSKKHFIKFIHA